METGMDSPNCANIEFTESENPSRIVVFFYTPFKCSQLKQSEKVEIPPAQVAKTGLIDGLHVYPEFFTTEEEEMMISAIDQEKWTKLLNRKVQHYGFEFKYGTNDVDVDARMGEFPAFCDPLMPRFENLLGDFSVNAEDASKAEGDQPHLQAKFQDDKEGSKSYFSHFGKFD
mmetsp:Transcript_36966/g.56626  ORF Transcript_36966/g.56626 Transcript_36966/m.56626 type:complete len:172 (+) Transcript_36966:264-779(+)